MTLFQCDETITTYVPLYPSTTEIVPDYVPNTVEIDCDGNIVGNDISSLMTPQSPQLITSMEPKQQRVFASSDNRVFSNYLSYELIYDYSCKDPDCTGKGQIFIFSDIKGRLFELIN